MANFPGRARLTFIVCTIAFAASALAQQAAPSAREQELMNKLDAVMQRLDSVEKELSDLKAQKAAAATAAPAAEATAQPASSQSAPQADLEGRIKALEAERASSLNALWKDGLRLESKDGDFKLQLGGRIYADGAWIQQHGQTNRNVFDEQNGGELRDVRLDLKGTIYKDLFYRMEYQLSGNNGPNGFTDTYIGLRNIPYAGTLTVGHFKEPFGFEELESDNYLTFMSRAQTTVFSPARNLGLQFSNAFLGEPKAERMTYAVGAFQNTDNWPSPNDADEGQGVSYGGRITGLPWYADGGKKLLHLGLAYNHRNPDGVAVNPYVLRPFPEARMNQFRWVDSEGTVGFRLSDARPEKVDLYGLEAALVYGPFSIASEYVRDNVDTTFGGNLSFDSYYVETSYFLTGESRPYLNAEGIFGRVRPNKNFGWGKGPGAWQLAVRYSSLDLDDAGVRGGKENNLTLGVNWYLNPSVRLMLNYVYADIQHDLYDGQLGIVQTRVQVDF